MPASTKTNSLTERPAWNALQAHYNQIHSRHLKTLFAEDPKRGERLAVEAAGLYFDYSKNRVTDETIRLLLASGRGVRDCASASTRCSAATKINVTEKRAVLHVALRAPRGASIVRRRRRTWCRKCTRYSIGWRRSPTASAMAVARVTPASASATSSISGSAVPTSARSWRTRRCVTTARGT